MKRLGLFVMLTVAGVAASWAHQRTLLIHPVTDPIPVKRIELEKNAAPPGGPYESLAEADFNAKLAAAVKTLGAAAPRILTANYEAALIDSDLEGQGEWRIAAAAPGLVPLEPLNLALANPKWKDQPATLDRVRGATRLWIDEGGERTLTFGWSARGREESGTVRFDVRSPAAAIAVLEMDVPAGRSVSAGEALVTGPGPSPRAECQRWRIAFGGKPRLDLQVRTPGAGPESVRMSRTARYQLAEGRAQFDFDFESLRGPATMLSFRADAGVRVLDVGLGPRGEWRFDEERQELRVTLPEPVTTGRVSLTAAVNLPLSGSVTPLPGIHGIGPGGEDTIELRVGPDVRLFAWEPGDYSPVKSSPTGERGYALTFRGSWRTGEQGRKPPGVALRPAAAEVQVAAELDWTLGQTVNTINARLRIKVLHGPVIQFALRLPPGYVAGPPQLTPEDSGAIVGSNPGVWSLEPTRPWSTGQTIDLQLELRGPPPEWDTGKTVMPVPRLALTTNAAFESVLLVLPEPGFRVEGPAGFERLGDRLRTKQSIRDSDALVTVRPMPREVAGKTVVTPTAAKSWDYDALTVKSTLDSGGVAVVLMGTIRAAPQRVWPLTLPVGATFEQARVGDRWVDAAIEGSTIRLPLPGGQDIPVEVRYRLPVDSWAGTMPVTEPDIPGDHAVWSSLEGGREFRLAQFRMQTWYLHRGLLVLAAAALGGVLVLIVSLRTRWRRVRGFVVALMVFMVAATALIAQTVDPATVYLRRDGERVTVLAPKALLEKLDAMIGGDRPAVAFTGASIEAADDGEQAALSIILSVRQDADGERSTTLPVHGLALESATLDGKPAYPVAAGERLSMTLPGRGQHSIVLRGRVPVVVRGGDRDWSLPLDPLPMTRLTCPAAVNQKISFPNRQGRESREEKEITVEFGSVEAVSVRRSGVGPAKPARLRTRDAMIWDVSGGDATATALFAATIEDGSVGRFEFEVPALVEPGRVSVRTAEGKIVGIRETALGEVRDGRQTFSVRLQEPVEGSATILLRLYPLLPLPIAPQLAGITMTGSTSESSALLVRTNTEVDRWDRSGAVATTLDAVQREMGPIAELDRLPAATAFRREGAAPFWVKPAFRPNPIPRPVTEELSWQFGAKAAVDGIAHWTLDGVSAVDFEVPIAVTVQELHGPGVAGWWRQGPRVRVWFRTPQNDVAIKWSGVWSNYGKSETFDLPLPPRANPARRVRLQSAPEYSMTVLPGPGWRPAITFRKNESVWQTGGSAPLKVKIEKRP